MIHFVDTSNHDDARGPINWAAVKDTTSPVMVHKACEGDPRRGDWYEDPYFTRDVLAARAAGFTLTGGYHCIAAGDQASINRQVDALLRLADTVGGWHTGWWMLDVESFAELKNLGVVPRLDDVKRFEDRWSAATGGWPLVHYIPRWMWTNWWGRASLTGLHGPLIASWYPSETLQPWDQLWAAIGGSRIWPDEYGGRTPDAWQWAATALVPGLPGRADINAYRGTLDELAALFTGVTMITDDDVRKIADAVLHRAVGVRGDAKTPIEAWQAIDYGEADAEQGLTLLGVLKGQVDDLAAKLDAIAPATPPTAAQIATELIKQLGSTSPASA